MAPKKSNTDPKGKAVMRAGTSVAMARTAALEGALPRTRVTVAGVAKVRCLTAASTNEHGATELRPAGSRLTETFYPIFLHTLYTGLVPPFSEFLLAILEVYQIQLLHLHPNSILILAIFAHFCEAYIEIGRAHV